MNNYKNILVTGGAGFIGSSFVADCVQRGCKVIVLDKLTYAGKKENLSWIKNAKNWELIVGDINDGELVLSLLEKHKIDALINFAAESHVDNSINAPSEFIRTNICGSFVLLEASLRYFKNKQQGQVNNRDVFRYVQISTDEVYGELGTSGKFSETTPYAPNSPYSASKAAADHLVRAWHRTYGLPIIITHCSNNYGPRQHQEKLIPRMINNALDGKKLPIYGKGENIRDWIHVEDHANGIWLALTKGKSGESYDFGGNAEEKNINLVKKICAILDRKKPKSSGKYEEQISFVTDRLGHDLRYAIDDSKAVSKLGFTRKYNLEQGLEMTVEWYLQNNFFLEN